MATTLWRRERHAEELAEEMRFHVEERIRENLAAGMSPEAAERDARQRFGHAASLREQTRDADLFGWLDALVREGRQAFRSLGKRPGLVATALLSLSLGIGATSAIFSVVDAVLLKPLPIPGAGRVVALKESKRDQGLGGNPARYRDYREQLTSVDQLTGFYSEDVTLVVSEGPTRLKALRTFGPALDLLGAVPGVGRGFSEEEAAGRGGSVAVLTHAAWQRYFGAAPEALGRPLVLDGRSYTVIGVLPAAFAYPEGIDLISPAPPEFQSSDRKPNYMGIVGRLKPGVPVERAQAELDAVVQRFGQEYPATDAGLRGRLVSLQSEETGEARQPLLLLLGAIGLVLMIACVNLATLLLARADERRHEAAVRVALGAGRASLLRLYLVESMLLALAGGIGGLLLAWLAVPLLQRLLPAGLPRLASAELDWRVVLFAMLVTVVCGLLFGIVPAWQAAGVTAGPTTLREGGRNTMGASRVLSRRIFVVSQVVLSMLLLVGAGLLGRSLYLVRRSPLGILPERVIAVRAPLSWGMDQSRLLAFYHQGLEALAALPGVQRVGLTDRLPLEGGSQSRPLRVRDGRQAEEGPEIPDVSFRAVSSEYFSTLGIPLRAGRLWSSPDGSDGPREIVVNQEFARRFLAPGQGIGAALTFDVHPEAGAAPRWYEVVGVVGDVRQRPNQPVQPPEVFIPFESTYWPLSVFVIRTNAAPGEMAAPIRRALAGVDPNIIVDQIAPLEEELGGFTAADGVRAGLVSVFALTALLLAAIGLYGVLSGDVAQRRQEIGVRLALGAEPRAVRWMILRRGLSTTAIGVCIGALGALALGRLLASMLFGITPADAVAFAGAGIVLLLVAGIVSYLPALRASKVDPMHALRQQ